jgi:perosamine synthetase
MTKQDMRIPLSLPDITEMEIDAVVEVLRSSRLSLGPKLAEFEHSMAAYVGTEYAAGLSSGTAGLSLGLRALNIGERDEVIVPSFTFIAAANAILDQRATPVFVDIDRRTLNLDPAAVRRAITARTRAIMAVHTFGCPADIEALLAIAEEHQLHLIEDACEAIGAEYNGRKVGGFGSLGVFSFYPNKPITMGEGGVLVTNDAELAATVKALRNQGRPEQGGWLNHALPGYNYRLGEMNCALGLAQLSRIESILRRREALARRYGEILGRSCPDVELPPLLLSNARISWFAFVARLPAQVNRDLVMQEMTARGIGCRAYFPPIHKMPLYSSAVELPVTDDVANRTLALPFFNQLREEEMEEVAAALRSMM